MLRQAAGGRRRRRRRVARPAQRRPRGLTALLHIGGLRHGVAAQGGAAGDALGGALAAGQAPARQGAGGAQGLQPTAGTEGAQLHGCAGALEGAEGRRVGRVPLSAVRCAARGLLNKLYDYVASNAQSRPALRAPLIPQPIFCQVSCDCGKKGRGGHTGGGMEQSMQDQLQRETSGAPRCPASTLPSAARPPARPPAH